MQEQHGDKKHFQRQYRGRMIHIKKYTKQLFYSTHFD